MRKEMTRRGLVGAAALAPAVLAACTVGGSGAPAQPQLAPATLTYTTWWLPPLVYGTATERAVADFEGRHSGVKVRIEGLTGTTAQQMEKVQTMAAGGAPPDLSTLRPQYPGGFAAKGMLLPLDDRLSKDRRATKGDFIPVHLERAIWQGKLWGLPAEAWFLITYYNPALFAKAGQAVPDERWTWDTWLDAARKLAAVPVAGGPAPDGPKTFATDDVNFWEMFTWAWGGEILSKAETECVLSRPPAPDAIQWRADLTTKHGVVPTAQDLQGTNVRALFEQGRLAMHTSGNWALTDIQGAAQMPWSVAVMPQGRAGRWTLGSGAIYGAFKEAKQHDAAWTLLADLVAGEGMKTLAAESSLLPSLRPMIKQELLPKYKPEWLKVVLEASKNARQPHYNHPRYVEMNQVFAEQLAPVWRGQKPARDATEEIVRQVNPLLK